MFAKTGNAIIMQTGPSIIVLPFHYWPYWSVNVVSRHIITQLPAKRDVKDWKY
jgi:hypothetical protein